MSDESSIPSGSVLQPSVGDARFLGLLLEGGRVRWPEALGDGDPHPGSPLASDLSEEEHYRGARVSHPVSKARLWAETILSAAEDHERLLEEALIRYSNGQGYRPTLSVITVARAVVELYSRQRWVIDPTVDTKERVSRWYAMECAGIRDRWSARYIGKPTAPPHADNSDLQALAADAARFEIPVRNKGGRPDSIGTTIPQIHVQANALLARYPKHMPGVPGHPEGVIGEHAYRLFSGSVHAGADHILSLLMPGGSVAPDGSPIHEYQLSPLLFWLSGAALLMAKFTAGYELAAWLGIEVDYATKRADLLAVEAAMDKIRAVR